MEEEEEEDRSERTSAFSRRSSHETPMSARLFVLGELGLIHRELHTPLSGRRRAQRSRPAAVTTTLTNEQTTVAFNEPVVCLSRCFTPTSVVAGIPTDKLAADCASIKQIKTTI